jgi:hypothetical protein
MVGMAPAEVSDVNATWLGRMERSSVAPKTKMTVTAFFGCPSASTRPIQPESGSTPSRATAKTSREEATTATLVFCGQGCAEKKHEDKGAAEKRHAHHDQTDHGYDGHEDARSLAESEGVELHEWLGGIECEERIQIWYAEQEKDGRDETEHAGSDRAADDSSTSDDTEPKKMIYIKI